MSALQREIKMVIISSCVAVVHYQEESLLGVIVSGDSQKTKSNSSACSLSFLTNVKFKTPLPLITLLGLVMSYSH